MLTRPLDHEGAAYTEDGTAADQGPMSRFSGAQDTLNPAGWVGYQQAGQDGSGWLGADVADPSTWQGRTYGDSQGMLARLHQEAVNGGQ